MSEIRIFGHLNTNKVAIKVTNRTSIYLNRFFFSERFHWVLFLFIIILTIQMMTTINPSMMIYFPAAGVIISGALAILSTPVTPTVMIPKPMAMTLSIQSPTRSNQNNATSMNAVCLDINAHANITHEMMIYLSDSRVKVNCSSRWSRMCLRNMNPDRIANIVNAITPRSVLLSTNTKNAPIQLVSQKSNIIHPLYIPMVVVISSSSIFLGEK